MKNELTFESVGSDWEIDELGNAFKFIDISERYTNFNVSDLMSRLYAFIESHMSVIYSKTDVSYYDTTHYIKLTDKDCLEHNGIIRVSEHPIYIQEWIDGNEIIEFGMSVVVYNGRERPVGQYNEDDITYDSMVSIYNYVLKGRQDVIDILDEMLFEVISA